MTVTKVHAFEKDEGVGEAIMHALQGFNGFATKKTVGQGALDMALLAANITKLTNVLDRGKKGAVYHVLVVAISMSIGLQLIVGALMGIMAKMKLKTKGQRRAANILNNVITGLASVICVINVGLSVLDMAAPIMRMRATVD